MNDYPYNNVAVLTCFLFLSKADLKRNISLLQAEVQKKDGMLLLQSFVTVKVCHLSFMSLCISFATLGTRGNLGRALSRSRLWDCG